MFRGGEESGRFFKVSGKNAGTGEEMIGRRHALLDSDRPDCGSERCKDLLELSLFRAQNDGFAFVEKARRVSDVDHGGLSVTS